MLASAILLSLLLWVIILLLPWQPWRVRETIESSSLPLVDSNWVTQVTVLIPARNEAATIVQTLTALHQQSADLKVVLVDDNSTDDTAKIAQSIKLTQLKVIQAQPLATGWSGKLWALEQGLAHVHTDYILLLDADIELQAGLLPTLLHKIKTEQLAMVSLMAKLRMVSFAEQFLMPAFIFFFKLLYPFALANSPRSSVSAAAGGCILIEKRTIEELGGFSVLKSALIDDCALAHHIKKMDKEIWIGLSHSLNSIRAYHTLHSIQQMVSRTAYAQLHYSLAWLLLCTALMVIAFIMPLWALFVGKYSMALLIILLQAIVYMPTLNYYQQPKLFALSLSIIGLLFLCFTWLSMLYYYFGDGLVWKNRSYNRLVQSDDE